MRQAVLPLLVALLLTGAVASRTTADAVMDGVNMGAAPFTLGAWGATDAGWIYRPSTTYNLTGVDTRFASADGRTCTLEFFRNGPPSSGGTLLASASFVTAATPTWCGATFAFPVALTAGQTYFVGFRNLRGMGVNFTSDAGATTWSPERFSFNSTGLYDSSNSSGYACQPILRLRGSDPVPEAGTLTALAGMLGAAGLWALRRRT